MQNPNSGSQDQISGINVTPLVDVSLVLVLVFMVSSPFFLKPLPQVELPKAASSSSEDEKNIAVSVSEEGLSVNETPIAKKALASELKRQRMETGFSFLLIRADEKISHGDVQDVMKMGKEAGYKRIAFATVPSR